MIALLYSHSSFVNSHSLLQIVLFTSVSLSISVICEPNSLLRYTGGIFLFPRLSFSPLSFHIYILNYANPIPHSDYTDLYTFLTPILVSYAL